MLAVGFFVELSGCYATLIAEKSRVEVFMSFQSFQTLQHYLKQQVIGQTDFINQRLIALLADGHILVEATPGWRKHVPSNRWLIVLKVIFTAFNLPRLTPSRSNWHRCISSRNGRINLQSGPILTPRCWPMR